MVVYCDLFNGFIVNCVYNYVDDKFIEVLLKIDGVFGEVEFVFKCIGEIEDVIISLFLEFLLVFGIIIVKVIVIVSEFIVVLEFVYVFNFFDSV